MSASPLPPSGGKPARAHLVETTSSDGGLVGEKENDERCVEVRLESLDDFLRHDGAGQLCASVGSNSVDKDVVLLALKSKGLGETKDTALG